MNKPLTRKKARLFAGFFVDLIMVPVPKGIHWVAGTETYARRIWVPLSRVSVQARTADHGIFDHRGKQHGGYCLSVGVADYGKKRSSPGHRLMNTPPLISWPLDNMIDNV